MLGLEVSARNDGDVLPVQVQNALKLMADQAMTQGWDPGKMAFGHGEVNGHKQPTEGSKIVTAVRQHHPQSEREALMSPAPMAEQYAPNFGMWGAHSAPSGTKVIPVKTTRERGAFRGETSPGATVPSKTGIEWSDDYKRYLKEVERVSNMPRATQRRLTEPWSGGRTYLQRLLHLVPLNDGRFPNR